MQQQKDSALINEDLGEAEDAFQEFFFEALKQRGIQNYDKAISALEHCLEIDSSEAVIYYELAKNHYALKQTAVASDNFQKALNYKPNNEDILRDYYENEVAAENYSGAIKILRNLIKIDSNYRKNLADLFVLNDQYNEAIDLLDSLDLEYGANEYRSEMRRQIYIRTNNTEGRITALKNAIEEHPENEQNYLNLIEIYHKEGRQDQAFDIAKEMLLLYPESTLVHLALYRFYLDQGEADKALHSMKTVFDSDQIDAASKYKVLNDFLLFVNEHPVYEKDLMEVSALLSQQENQPALYRKLGEYHLAHHNKADALRYFEMGLKNDPSNLEMMKNTLILRIDLQQYEKAKDLAKEATSIFPAQPVFYLFGGVALNKLKNYSEAVEILTFGLDFLIENPGMEADFYQQLSVAYYAKGDQEKATMYKAKAFKILKENN